MKKSIILAALIATGSAQAAAPIIVTCANWSQSYVIGIYAEKQWKYLQPRTMEVLEIDPSHLMLKACDKKSHVCGATSSGNFTWKGKPYLELYPRSVKPNDMIVFDAGLTFFKGLPKVASSLTTASTSKTIKYIVLKQGDNDLPTMNAVTSKVKMKKA